MKRTTKKVEKRTFMLKNAIPMFVSLVSRGANFTPLAELRYSDDTESFSAVEINRMEFAKANFDRAGVEQYLQENDYADYTISEDENVFVVPGIEADQFQEVSAIDYADGVKLFVGKLKQPTPEDQAAGEVIASDSLDFNQEAAEATATENAEVIQEGDLSVDDLVGNQASQADGLTVNEEAKPEVTDSSSEEVETGFSAEGEAQNQQEKEEVMPDPIKDAFAQFTDAANAALADGNVDAFRDTVNAFYLQVVELTKVTEAEPEPTDKVTNTDGVEVNLISTSFTMTDEMKAEIRAFIEATFAEIKSSTTENTIETENTIDETEIVVQNSQAVNTEEITTAVTKDEKAEKFAQRQNANLFGL